MSRVVTHAVKQASLNLRDMIDKKQIGLEIDDLTEVIAAPATRLDGVKVWKSEAEATADAKPEILNTVIEQIRGLFDVGKEVKEWTVSYYPPPIHNAERKGTFNPQETRIEAGGKGLGSRFVVIVGSRDIANMQVSMGSMDAENGYMVLPGDCLQLKLAICPVLDVYFNNVNNEKLAARKGFRETMIKKNVGNRHILVFDAHVEMTAIASKVKDLILEKKGINVEI